jgi:hypothetical protein
MTLAHPTLFACACSQKTLRMQLVVHICYMGLHVSSRDPRAHANCRPTACMHRSRMSLADWLSLRLSCTSVLPWHSPFLGCNICPPVFLHPQQLHENTSRNTISQLIFVHHLLLNIRRPHRISERRGPHPKKPVLEPVYRPSPGTHMCVRPSAFCMTFRSYLCS